MIRINQNSNDRRVLVTLLLTIVISFFWVSTGWSMPCEGVCDNPVTDIDHTWNPDMGEPEPPVADFCLCPYIDCDSILVDFVDWSTGHIDRWEWNFGDPSSGAANYSNEENPSHLYIIPGIYTVTLTVYGPGGNSTEIKQDAVILLEDATADFEASTTEGCVGVPIQFWDRSTNANAWYWDFGDGDTSRATNPTHTYTATGTYTVTLAVTNECGKDVERKEMYITIGSGPTADFTSDKTEACFNTEIQFTDLSTDADSLLWEFGDGTTSIDQNPTHTYTQAGVYTVRLTAVNKCGEDVETKEEYITIHPGPVADFSGTPTTVCVGETVAFTDLSTNADEWYWTFGDGDDSPARNPRHTYTATGYYTVSLTVKNDCGEDTETKEMYIRVIDGPTAEFSAEPRTVCVGKLVSFTDESTDADTWAWNFGDGSTSGSQNPTHAYMTPGVYTVSLTVTNRCGDDTETKEEYITVLAGPEADFDAEPTDVCVGGTVYFSDMSTNADEWHWTFGDGGTSDDPNPQHTYTVAGAYTVSLTVKNDCGDDTETREEYITVHPGPTADFSGTPRRGMAPLTVSFTDLSTTNFTITSWAWEFGDTDTSSQQNPTHVYTAPGVYTVKLTVTDECGKDDETKLEYIEVIDTCAIDFTSEPNEGCAPLEVFFEGTSTGPCDISSWTWDFGDTASGSANTATGRDASHTYMASGVYTVTLTAEDSAGTKTVVKNDLITVYDVPEAAFQATPSSGAAPLTVQFADMSTSSLPIDSWEWDFGDPLSSSNTSTAANPSHYYENEGVYNVMLIVTNECGPDTAYGLIDVSPAISIIKAVDKDKARVGEELLYTVTVKNNGPDPISYVMVSDTIPDSAGYVPGSVSGLGNYDRQLDLVRWVIPTLAPLAEETLSFKVILDGPFTTFPTIVSNQAFASLPLFASAAAPATQWASNIVETEVDEPTGELLLEKSVDVNLALPGDELVYTITITNPNPATAIGVEVFDAIPELTTYVFGSITAGGTWDSSTDSLYWDLGNLAALADTSVSFTVTIDADCADGSRIPNTALVTSSYGGTQSNEVLTSVSLTPLVVTKTTSSPSGMIGDLIRFRITVENFSDQLFTDVVLLDTMPLGIFYVEGTSLVDGGAVADPVGNNPYEWALGDLAGNSAHVVEYTILVGASAEPGMVENVARAHAMQGAAPVASNRAVAPLYILSYHLTGAIRGKVVVDCDGDGVPDMNYAPVGTDVYLDDGSHSRVNEEGMFFFSTVRPGERVVALDERDLDGYYVPEGAEASVFVHVHETGESYVIFRICPEYPLFDITKRASVVPKVKLTKRAKLSPDQETDTLGVKIDYQIDIKSSGLMDPLEVRVVDSFPDDVSLLIHEGQSLTPQQQGTELTYQVTAAEERLQQSVQYALTDLTPGLRRFLTNKVYLAADVRVTDEKTETVYSEPAEVTSGPFLLVPPEDVQITLTPALFITSKADLQAPAIPQLEAVADSIMKYADADIKVEGHTDYRRINTVRFPSNWELGEARALAVVDWLVENRSIERDRLAYESFAATRPVVTVGTTSEELQPNRRTEVIIRSQLGGFVDPSQVPAGGWERTTSLILEPTRFDTLFETAAIPVEADLDDTWEVVVVVMNVGSIASEDGTMRDIIPEGVEFIDNSAFVDGEPISVRVAGNMLSIDMPPLGPDEKTEIRYRLRGLDGGSPTGGGPASVEVMTPNNEPVVEESNAVFFE